MSGFFLALPAKKGGAGYPLQSFYKKNKKDFRCYP